MIEAWTRVSAEKHAMSAYRLRHPHWIVILALVLTVALAQLTLAQDAESLDGLKKLYSEQYAKGNYRAAIEIGKRSLAAAEKQFGPDHPEVAAAANSLAAALRAQALFAEAEPYYLRALAIREKSRGPDHAEVAQSLNNLGLFYQSIGRLADAEAPTRRAVAIFEKVHGPEHAEVATALNNLALLYGNQGKYAEAAPLFARSLAIREKVLGPDHVSVGNSLGNLGAVYSTMGRYRDAEPLLQRALSIREKASGADHPTLGQALGTLASLYLHEDRFADAEPLLRRSLSITEKSLGPTHPSVANSLAKLAGLYERQGRYDEADPLYKRGLEIYENAVGPDHPDVAIQLNHLAISYHTQGRFREAEQLYKRSLAIREKALGPDHPDVGESLNNLASIYSSLNRFEEAERLSERGLAIREKTYGPDNPVVAGSLNNMASLYEREGRAGDAEKLYLRSLEIQEKSSGPDSASVAQVLNNLAGLYSQQGRKSEAEPLYKRSISISEKLFGPDHPIIAINLNNLAALYFEREDWAHAVEYWRRSTGILTRSVQSRSSGLGAPGSGNANDDLSRQSFRFRALIKALSRTERTNRTFQEMFETAQWADVSETAFTLSQMALRSAKGNVKLAEAVRERQDLIAEWARRDGLRTAAFAQAPAQRNKIAEEANAIRLTEIDHRLGEINTRLGTDFPDYAEFARPTPLSVAQVQAELGQDEVLVLFADTPEWKPAPQETFVFFVSKTNLNMVTTSIGRPRLVREVAALRCGLDPASWLRDGGKYCAELLKLAPGQMPKGDDPLPVDPVRANVLYQMLFGAVGFLEGKHLLIVPSGALTQLPFQVLVTEPPKDKDFRKVRWLVRDHAVTILPAVSSLKALRRVGKPSGASRQMIGFGDPLLDGQQNDPQYGAYFKEQADQARAQSVCPRGGTDQRSTGLRGPGRGLSQLARQGAHADVEQIRRLAPLPETAAELCAVARDLAIEPGDIRLGARATEREVKALSASGQLAQYRVLHFATHGALAGQLSGASEPGLILTPPAAASDEDDGYLSASEIATLKLDADWVILSACNTAGASGREDNAEALSGLARAFFYAQARSLLVSHWEVDSQATVKLVTAAVRETARGAKTGRSEALRRAMLDLIDKGEPHEAHPFYWAPFVLVGEGAAGR